MGPGPSNNTGGGGPSGGGAGGSSNTFTPFPYNIPPNPNAPPANPSMSSSMEKKDLNYNLPFIQGEAGAAGGDLANEAANIPPPSYDSLSPDDNLAESNKPKPQPRSKILPGAGGGNNSSFPELPNVPLDLPDVPDDTNNSEEIDFDDLSRRFEELKKRK